VYVDLLNQEDILTIQSKQDHSRAVTADQKALTNPPSDRHLRWLEEQVTRNYGTALARRFCTHARLASSRAGFVVDTNIAEPLPESLTIQVKDRRRGEAPTKVVISQLASQSSCECLLLTSFGCPCWHMLAAYRYLYRKKLMPWAKFQTSIASLIHKRWWKHQISPAHFIMLYVSLFLHSQFFFSFLNSFFRLSFFSILRFTIQFLARLLLLMAIYILTA
jgi:hypothetical protein